MSEFITASPAETEALAQKIADKISPCVIAMTGDLGAGKTASQEESIIS